MDKVLYRNESCFGSNVRNLKDIIEHEMSILRNWDIPEYVLKHYKLPWRLKRKLKAVVSKHNDWDYPFVGPIDCRISLRQLIDDMVDAVSKQTGIDCKYGLWLAEAEDVQELYSTENCQIDCYPTTEAVFSDLGPDGKLFGYANLPVKQPE